MGPGTKMTAAERADLAPDAAFLVRALLAGDAEEQVEPVMGAPSR